MREGSMGREQSGTRDVVFGCLVATIAVLSMLVGLSIADNLLPPYRMAGAITAIEQQVTVESLRAAQATANWTFWMLMLGVASFVVTTIGAYFVWQTLRETSKATRAAIESLDHTRMSTHVELRAYVLVESVVLHDFVVGKCPKAVCTLVNSGITPARRLLALGKLELLDDPNAPVSFSGGRLEVPKREIGADQKAPYGAKWGEELTQQDYDAVMTTRKKYYVFALECDYIDVFGEPHRTVARAYLANVSLPVGAGERMALASENNDAN
jgi:hypothetical protein